MIQGMNGSGKSSLIEALHYACYLKSFRTYTPRELTAFNATSFFIKVFLTSTSHESSFNHEIQVGCSGTKKLVKVDQMAVSSYKELTQYYRVITLTEDDLGLIKGGPELRRSFLDQALILHDADTVSHLKAYKVIAHNRNALLQQRTIDEESYHIWTRQLWEQSQIIQRYRRELLKNLEKTTNSILASFFPMQVSLSLEYQAKKMQEGQTYDDFIQEHSTLFSQERTYGRSLFGAHLDDMYIRFQGTNSKQYASRGQQKLSVVLIKIAQLKELYAAKGPAIFLLDDFMTDFDTDTGIRILDILMSLNIQLIFTSPTQTGSIERYLTSKGAQQVLLHIEK